MASLRSSVDSASSLFGYLPTAPSISRKRETCDLTGSVYLISSDGRMIKLPMPTNSPRDPLNWSGRKRAGAFLALMIFAISGLTEVQGPSLMLASLAMDFPPSVTTQNCVPQHWLTSLENQTVRADYTPLCSNPFHGHRSFPMDTTIPSSWQTTGPGAFRSCHAPVNDMGWYCKQLLLAPSCSLFPGPCRRSVN